MMENKQTSIVKAPKWVAVLSSVITGWLVLLFTTFFSVMAIGAILNSINEPITSGPPIIATLFIAALFGITLGIIIGKSLYIWYSSRRKATGIILLIILVLLAVSLVPQAFKYVTM